MPHRCRLSAFGREPVAGSRKQEMRRTFYEEQARYRRATWRWTMLAAAAAIVMGLPLSLVLTPVVYLLALVTLHSVDGVLPISPVVWASVDKMAALIPTAIDAYESGPWQLLRVAGPLAAVLIVPGAVTILVVWLGVRRLLERVGLEATLQALGARAPDSVLEERQFQNVVEEIAIAAGLTAPAVWVTEHLSANMALVGTTPDRAAIVVSRRLLNTCDRDETQALVAHLIASLAHGDQAIALRIESVYLTGAALNALVNAPFGRAGRQVVGALLRALVHKGSPHDATRALATLLHEWEAPANDLTRFLERDATRPPSVWRHVLHLLLLPLYLVNMAVLITASLVEAGLVAPVLAAVCRARRYLADASAVELARNPTQLARALRNIAGSLGDPHWAPARLLTVVASDVTDPWRSPGGLTNAHPPAEKRIKRLAAQGAILSWEPQAAEPRRWPSVLEVVGAIVLVPLVALMAYLSAVIVALVTVLAIGAMAVTLAAIHGVFQLLQ
jgi:Zn-dependent protease with chaperone function